MYSPGSELPAELVLEPPPLEDPPTVAPLLEAPAELLPPLKAALVLVWLPPPEDPPAPPPLPLRLQFAQLPPLLP